MAYEVEAVILAGGRSRRMGQDKALLPFGAFPTLAEYQYRRLLPLFSRVFLSAKSDKFPFDAPLIPDESSVSSPMIALAAILRRSRCDGVFLLGVDMPFVRETTIRRILDTARSEPDAPIVSLRSERGIEPLCALYRPRLLPRVETLIAREIHRLQTLHQEVPGIYLPVEDPEELSNLNRPEEYERALGRVES